MAKKATDKPKRDNKANKPASAGANKPAAATKKAPEVVIPRNLRGTIKVMVDSRGVSKIQETKGDTIKIYTTQEWQKELLARAQKGGKNKPAPKNEDKDEDAEDAGGSLIQEDTEDDE